MSLTICNDGHRCLNGGLCTPNPNDDGAFFCDCDSAVSVVTGISCEHEATTFCTYDQAESKVSFCTNKGECQVEVGPGDSHVDCKCKDGYEGAHCQFIEGSTEKDFYQNTLPKSGKTYNLKAGQSDDTDMLFVPILLVALLVILGAAYVYMRKRRLATPMTKGTNIASAELALDSDGEVLKESVRSNPNSTNAMNGKSNSSIPNGNGRADYDEDNGDDEKGQMEEIQISNSNEIL